MQGAESAIAMPLLTVQRRLGVVVPGRGGGRPRFTETDMAVITELSRRLAAGLANVETSQRLREVNAELSRVTEALREQQQAKDRFIATLSRELRNPLAAIKAAADLLTLNSPAGHPAIGVLDRQVSALVLMADDLLDASTAPRANDHPARSDPGHAAIGTGRIAIYRARVSANCPGVGRSAHEQPAGCSSWTQVCLRRAGDPAGQTVYRPQYSVC